MHHWKYNMFGIDNTNISNDVRKKFDMSHFMKFDSGWYDSMDSEFIDWILKQSPDGWYIVKEPDGRPDLVSYNLYGDTQYWWILLLYNEIICVDELKNGMEIKFINLIKMQNEYLQLKISNEYNI